MLKIRFVGRGILVKRSIKKRLRERRAGAGAHPVLPQRLHLFLGRRHPARRLERPSHRALEIAARALERGAQEDATRLLKRAVTLAPDDPVDREDAELDRLIGDIGEAARTDAELARASFEPVDLGILIVFRFLAHVPVPGVA